MIDGELAALAQGLAADRVAFVHATVVRVQRPTSSTPGDTALVLGDGTIHGFVGGHCAQTSLRLHSARALETGAPVLLRIVPGDGDPWGEDDGVVVEHNPCLSGGTIELFLDPQLPLPRLVVVGETPIARALQRVGAAAGFEVAESPSNGDAAVVVASHGDGEERVLADALRAGVPYVALVASDRRGAAVRASLDVEESMRERLHTPAGLALGARTPGETAVAVLAQLIEQRTMGMAFGPGDARDTEAVPVVAATARDPICGMQVLVSPASLSMEFDGERLYFCGEGCRSAFTAQHPPHVL